MFAVALFLAPLQDPSATEAPVRTPAIYRCPAGEAESKFFEPLVEDDGYDTFCVEPKPGPKAAAILTAQKVKKISASAIDTPANLRWRNATIDFVNGKISPKTWLAKVHGLGETVHFLSNPRTPKLRAATGMKSHAAVFAEMTLLCLPGKPCLTADDTGTTRYLPGPGAEESWLLAMRDYLGPTLYYRAANPFLVTGKIRVIRADAKPGLLQFEQKGPKKTITFFLNNSSAPIDLPPIDFDKARINIGLNMDGPKPQLLPQGFLTLES